MKLDGGQRETSKRKGRNRPLSLIRTRKGTSRKSLFPGNCSQRMASRFGQIVQHDLRAELHDRRRAGE